MCRQLEQENEEVREGEEIQNTEWTEREVRYADSWSRRMKRQGRTDTQHRTDRERQ